MLLSFCPRLASAVAEVAVVAVDVVATGFMRYAKVFRVASAAAPASRPAPRALNAMIRENGVCGTGRSRIVRCSNGGGDAGGDAGSGAGSGAAAAVGGCSIWDCSGVVVCTVPGLIKPTVLLV